MKRPTGFGNGRFRDDRAENARRAAAQPVTRIDPKTMKPRKELAHEVIQAAAWSDRNACEQIAAFAGAILDENTGVLTASRLMALIAPSADPRLLSSALWATRKHIADFAPYWRQGSRKTKGGNLSIEYIGQKF